ncbi:MAG: hypothetical protein K2I03_12765 [Lachnospiraceae bacterium]|nr:hypothetical protein [Lachnospiraceae bacterium]
MKSLVIMGMVILMGISSFSLNDVKNIEDSNLSMIESVDADETKDAGFDNGAVESKTYEEQAEQQTTTVNDEDVLECKEVITEEFFEGVVSVSNIDPWRRPISEQKDIDKLKTILWRFKLKEGKKPTLENFVLGGKSFDFKYQDGTETNVSISGTMLVYNDIWYDIVNWDETGMQFCEDVAVLYPEEKGYYGEDVFDCQELLSKEFFEDVEEVSFSYGDNTLTKEKEIEKFKKKMWLFKVRKSEKTDSGKSDSLVFDIKSKDGSKKQVIIIINDGTMIIDGDCYDIVNYNEVLSEFMEAMEELFTSED